LKSVVSCDLLLIRGPMSQPTRIPKDHDGNSAARARGRSRKRWLGLMALLFALVLTGFLVDFVYEKNFSVVVPGKLYRSGQPRESQLDQWIEKYRLKGIINLRNTLNTYEEELARTHGVKIYNIPFSARTGLGDTRWQTIREIMTDEKNLPLLVHCRSGADRTGLVVAMYRIEVQGWPMEKAMREMCFNYHIPSQYPILQQEIRARCGAKNDREAPIATPGELVRETP